MGWEMGIFAFFSVKMSGFPWILRKSSVSPSVFLCITSKNTKDRIACLSCVKSC